MRSLVGGTTPQRRPGRATLRPSPRRPAGAPRAGPVHDLDRELVPRAVARAGGVEDADVAAALGDLDQRGREVPRPRRAAALVGHDLDLVALGPEAQHGCDEVPAARAEEPGGADDRVLV